MIDNFKNYIFALNLFVNFANASATTEVSQYEALSGVNLKDSKAEWDQKFLSRKYVFGKKPAKFLKSNAPLIPRRSKVLDLGMGEGRNAVYLATKGHKVVGIDISSVAIEKANALAKEFSTEIKTVVASLDRYEFRDNSFDVILSFYYVDRNLINRMINWLRPGGLIIYEAHTTEKLKEGRLINKNYLVKPKEILSFFPNFKLILFEEPKDGSYRSSIIVQKPK